MFQSVNKFIIHYELFVYQCYPKSVIQRFNHLQARFVYQADTNI